MTRPRITPDECPWAHMQAAGLISAGVRNNYRNGHTVPGPGLVRWMNAAGYEVRVVTLGDKRRAVCNQWPGRLMACSR